MNLIFFDAHCDTLEKVTDSAEALRKNSFHIDLERLMSYDGYIQVFAAFVDKSKWESPHKRALSMIDTYYLELEKNKPVSSHCTNIHQIETALNAHRVACMLSVEGGEAIEGSLEKLDVLYGKGVRIMTLTWNYANEICDGIGEASGGGLTDFGKQVVKKMNRLGMIVDVSHISVKGFWDVLENSTKPFIASHSNAKGLCPHPRNLDDSQIKAIINTGGCIGVNFYPLFVAENRCTAEDIVNHIEYFLELGGENNIGIGSDFDGIDTTPREIHGAEGMNKIVECMLRRNFTQELIEKITSKNFLRVIKLVCG